MQRQMTDQQKQLLKLLNNLSNVISNCVWIAENREDANINDKIETAIYHTEFMLKEIKSIQTTS